MAPDARRTAYDVLRGVHADGAYANLLLPKLLAERNLDERDRALAAELAYGTLRAEGQLDHVLAACTSRGLDSVEPMVLDVLRLGAYQLLRTRVPSHAAVSESVELVRRAVGERAVGFVNAVLRKVTSRAGDLGAPDQASDPLGYLAVTTAHPRWVVEAFRDALDGDMVETASALQADDTRPEVHLAARRISRDELLAECAQAGFEATPGELSPYAVRLAGGDPGRLPAVRSGAAGVQDEGSQLCAMAALAALPDGEGRLVVDLCAGPGGKASLLRSLLDVQGRGDRLVAIDRHEHRARLVAQALGSGREHVSVVGDGLHAPILARSADLVLVDAPCSGLGALRRRPEARWRKQLADLDGLVPLQRALLTAAAELVRPGGTLMYVVCSPHVAETRSQMQWAEATLVGMSLLPVGPLLPHLPGLFDTPCGQLWTHRHGTDAMFLARLERADDTP